MSSSGKAWLDQSPALGGARGVQLGARRASTGQSMTITRLVPFQLDETSYALDLRVGALRAARQGVYREWSLRETPPSVVRRFFRRSGDGRYALDATIRRMVRFAPLNTLPDGGANP
jgi:chemotaxis methyl-accepting protein methylase